MFYLKSLIKVSEAVLLFLFLTACGGKAGKSTSPGGRSAVSAEQIQRLDNTRVAAEEAENAYYEKKLERIELERQLEDL
jgi:hypothetical protein